MIYLALLFTADRLTKSYADLAFTSGATEVVIPRIIGFSYTVNSGAAWGILSDKTWLLSVFTWVVIFVCLYCLLLKPLYSPWMHTALILIIAGGLGNLYDRIVQGGVTDFLMFLFMRFPIFNFADCCISTGAAIAMVNMLTSAEKEPLFLDGTVDKSEVSSRKTEDTGSRDETEQ